MSHERSLQFDSGKMALGDAIRFYIDCVFVGNAPFPAAIPVDAPAELRDNIWAAWLAWSFSVRSIDSLKKRYVDPYTERGTAAPGGDDENFKDILATARSALQTVEDTVARIDVDNWRTDRLGQWVGLGALNRLTETFAAASVLFRVGAVFEAHALCRLILEQMAWAHKIRNIDDDSIFQVSPPGAISSLKLLFPRVGRLYGELSQHTHIAPRLTTTYLRVLENQHSVTKLSTNRTASTVGLLAILADIYAVVSEIMLAQFLSEFTFIEPGPDGLTPKVDRPSTRAIAACPHAKWWIDTAPPAPSDGQ